MELIKFVPEQLLILVAGLYILGMFLKATPKVQNWMIPWVLLMVGIGASMSINGLTVMGAIQGTVCTGVAVLTNQLIKQTTQKEINQKGDIEFRY